VIASSSGSVEVRTLAAPTRIEIEQLAAIFDRYRAHYGEAENTSKASIWLKGNLSSGRLHAFVAENNGECIGFAITLATPASLRLGVFWQIRDLFVVPNHRRLGVGGALLDVVRVAAISAGALRLSLQTEADNTSALRLYAKNGNTMVEGYRSLTLPLEPDSRGG
jgi:GNAT superfamily N-acetyltransferase